MKLNRLAKEKSPYLLHAASQAINWYPWGDEAFQAAAAEDKPLFLSSGAVWCHWCHVMAKESFEDKEVARILNRDFISVKVDRDERPDIDRRFQEAAAAAGVGGGWPLTLFLTPERKLFFIGTYFPPNDAYGRPGFKRILKTVAEVYKTKRHEIEEHAEKLQTAIQPKEMKNGWVDVHLLDEAAGLMLSQFDSKNGGFGKLPKFPMPGALEFLMERYALTENGIIANAVRKTLEAMAKGGFHDQLGGGFHRYSVDESWSVPHFEKMADDNAWLLKNYVDAFMIFGEEEFSRVAKGIIGFVREVLSDEEGGFYASQDADVTPDDEGGYFTWTVQELNEVLSEEEYKVISLHFLDERGTTHHDPSKRVLLVSMPPEEIAQGTGIEVSAVKALINSGKAKLLERRRLRKEPFVDKTFYTSLNGMLIAAFLRAYRVLKEKETRDFALRSLTRIIKERYVEGELYHTEGVKALFDDYTALIEALVEAYEVTADKGHLDLADQLMEQAIRKFWDRQHDAFFDAEGEVLGSRLKSLEDIPQPSCNSLAVMLLVRLSVILKKQRYRDHAEMALRALIPFARHRGVHAGYFFAALDAFYHMLSIEFEDRPGSELVETALARVKPYTAASYGPGSGRVLACYGNVCYQPIEKLSDLEDFLKKKPYLQGRQ
ncbi:MAG: hypothetical protein A4E57_02347 [Syntrophorhabdaceae bacterium PtaU1.Bin034]|nr:MAG: hypothetical protein A4E57_02347 [Syntrophorhabdaceae bacterium PtaU1.Bin034]